MSNFATSIGVVGLERKVSDPSAREFYNLYQTIGLNTGNLMFTNSVYHQINGDLTNIGYGFNPAEINKNYDVLVVPAANWINNKSDWGFLIDLLEKISIPVITIGIGLQSVSSNINDVQVNDDSMRLIRLLSSKSKWISCRGEFTNNWLRSVGVKNAITTGCPSIYMKFGGVTKDCYEGGQVILQSTRYWLSGVFVDNCDINRRLYSLAGSFNLPIIFQSEPEEIDYLVNSAQDKDEYAKNRMRLLAKLYGFSQEAEVKDYLNSNGRVFFDLEQWSSFVQSSKGVIGTRLHGAIIALNSGRPARLVVHDSRTQEISTFANIPTVKENELTNVSEKRLEEILDETDVSQYQESRVNNEFIYRSFLEECGLSPKL